MRQSELLTTTVFIIIIIITPSYNYSSSNAEPLFPGGPVLIGNLTRLEGLTRFPQDVYLTVKTRGKLQIYLCTRVLKVSEVRTEVWSLNPLPKRPKVKSLD